MNVTYGDLDLRIVRVIDFVRQPVLSDDKTSYLFTKITLNAVGIVNSQEDPSKPGVGLGQSKVRGAAGAPFAVVDAVEPATSPIITDRAIRHWMSLPRRKLVISAGGQELLRVPRDGQPTDAHNGPIVESYDVHEFMGAARTFVVHFQISTCINECNENQGQYAALLTNRWSQHHELDSTYGLTIITTGEAYFRTDLLRTFNVTPDQLRTYLFLPIPVGYQREAVKVSAPSDSGILAYEFHDVQKSDQFVAGNEVAAAHIQATYREAMQSDPDLVQTMLDGINKYYEISWFANRADREKRRGGDPALRRVYRSGTGTPSGRPVRSRRGSP